MHFHLQEKQRDLKAPPTSRPRDSDVAGTLRGLNLQQAQALLAATQRRSYAHQVGESGRRFSSDWQQSLQDAARDSAYMAHNHGRIGRLALTSCGLCRLTVASLEEEQFGLLFLVFKAS